MSTQSIVAICTLGLLVLCRIASAGQYVQVSPDLEVYYEEAGGAGPPLIFVPGWTGTNEFFVPHQLESFAEKFHVSAYDPRSQGRSSKTLENNHYAQHAKDLHAFMEALKLHEVVVVGWSCGCHDTYAYLRTFGTHDVRAYVCVDQPPRSMPAEKADWADFSNAEEAGAFINATVHDRRAFLAGFVPTMMKRPMTQEEISWATDQMLKTPTYAAALLAADCAFADSTAEAKAIDGKVPVLNIVSEEKPKRRRPGWPRTRRTPRSSRWETT